MSSQREIRVKTEIDKVLERNEIRSHAMRKQEMKGLKMRIRILAWIISLWAMPVLLWGTTADELVKKTGITGGLCAFPQATQEDVKLALELARRPTFVVHVMAKNWRRFR